MSERCYVHFTWSDEDDIDGSSTFDCQSKDYLKENIQGFVQDIIRENKRNVFILSCRIMSEYEHDLAVLLATINSDNGYNVTKGQAEKVVWNG